MRWLRLDLIVGDVAGNTERIIEYAVRARDELQADLVVFPELAVSGYPPEDLLFHAGLKRRVIEGVLRIRDEVRGIAVLMGTPEYVDGAIYNAAVVFADGVELASYRKQLLPNYSVFDEVRYFERGRDAAVFSLNGIRIGINICEDVWGSQPAAAARAAGAEVLIAINGSPYGAESQERREEVVRARVARSGNTGSVSEHGRRSGRAGVRRRIVRHGRRRDDSWAGSRVRRGALRDHAQRKRSGRGAGIGRSRGRAWRKRQ